MTEERLDKVIALLERVAFEQKRTYEQIQKFVHAMVEEAESEIPEKMRRFIDVVRNVD